MTERITAVDPVAAERVAARLLEVADRFQVDLDHVRQVIDAKHGCWGDDEFGTKFAEGYTVGESQAMTQAREILEGVRALSGNLSEIRAAFARLDDGGFLELENG